MATVTDHPAKTEQRGILAWALLPWFFAIYVVISSMWGVASTDVIDTDAARHSMNGAFIYDLIRTGNWQHPVDYAQQYYGHLPSLSMPYHPPVFPSIEALFYALFGVKLFTARLVVALCAGACVILVYRLIERTLGNRVLAACVAITMAALGTSQLVAQDVMLEYPAMVFMLAAACCLTNWEGDFTWKQAAGFAVLTGLGFWTKQHAVILGGVPPLWAIMTGRWRLLLRKPAWLALGLFASIVGAYIFLSSRFHNAGIHEAATSTTDLGWIAKATLPSYFQWIGADLLGVSGVFAACAALAYGVSLFRRGKTQSFKLGMYWAWVVSTALVLTDLGNTNNRYLFFVFPATLAIGYAWLYQGCARLWNERIAMGAAIAFASVFFGSGFFVQREFLRGPAEAAAAVVQGRPTRILYAGEADGNFIFATRVLDPKLQVTVIPAGKVPQNTYEPERLEAFCRKYGVNWLILENVPILHSWSSLQQSVPAFLKLERTIPLQSTRFRWRTGSIQIFRVEGASEAPGGVLKIPVWRLGAEIDVKL